jgi:hypothetical protein
VAGVTGLVLREPQPSLWPSDEASPYVDWWISVERDSGTREAGQRSPLTFSKRVEGAGFELSPNGSRGAKRQILMWNWALPKGDRRRRPSRTSVPSAGFGKPLTKFATPPRTVFVVIDTAINPLHDRFQGNDGRPRILAHWMMEGRFDPGSARVPFGCEARTEDLVAALDGRTEEMALRHLGAHSFDLAFAPRETAQLAAHGTHVLDLAAGTDPGDEGPEAKALRAVPILAVSLPSNRLLSPSGAFLEVFVDQALSWAEARLDELLGPDSSSRVVVNLSYGLSAGSKDGSDYLPRRIAEFRDKRSTACVTMPAGNDGLAQMHAILEACDGRRQVGWLVLPSDPFSAYAEVWTTGPPAGIGVEIEAPGGDVLPIPDLGQLKPGKALELARPKDQGGTPVARLYSLGGGDLEGRRGVLFCVAPTRRIRPGGAVAPAGFWALRLTGEQAPRTEVHFRADVHLQSERPLTSGSLVGRPSRLVPVGEVKPVREGTLNAVAVGSKARIIDATRASDECIVAWSSQGDTTYLPAFEADGTEEAERSPSRPGLLAAGYRSGTVATVQGTSFASALAARAALLSAMGGEA